MMSTEKKRKAISAGSTAAIMALLFLFMLLCGFTYQNPAPAPKNVILVDLEDFGDGHRGGGNRQEGGSMGEDRTPPTAADNARPSAKQPTTTTRQNTHTDNRSSVKQPSTPAVQQPKVNTNALFKGAASTGQGTGHDLGAGHAKGNGLGLGDAGSGGNSTGRGLGTGTRSFRGNPNLSIDVNEQPGSKVYVQVEVDENGNVVDAKVPTSNKKYNTTATTRTQDLCVARAKTVKYAKGEAEYRIIVFTF